MDVISTKKGYYGGKIRNEGDEFTLQDIVTKDGDGNSVKVPVSQQFSKKWMKASNKAGRQPKTTS